MFAQDFMRNALLAGTFIALACGVSGWFVVLRAQVFAGDALSHVAFPGALAAAAAGADQRIGLFAATVAAAAGIGLLGRGAIAGAGARPGAQRGSEDAAIGTAFTFILGIGVFFLTRLSTSAGLSAGEARLAAAVALAVTALTAAIARPLLFASVVPDLAAARGVRTRLLGVAFVALLGVIAAEAAQAVGALLLLGLLAVPAAAAHRIATRPFAGVALAGVLALAATWAGLALAYAVPSLPPSSAIVLLAVGSYVLAVLATRRRGGVPHR